MVRKLVMALFVPMLLVAACSDDGDRAQDVETVDADAAVAALRAAPDAAAEAGSGRMEMTMSMTIDGETLDLTAAGVFAGQQAQMEMDFGAMLAAIEEAGEEVPPGLDEPMQIVVDGSTMYMRWPFLEAMGGAPGWMSVSAEELGVASDAMGTGWSATNNPAQMLETLRGIASKDIEELGTDEIRGAEATGYRVEVDLAKAAEQMGEDFRASFEASIEELGLSTMAMDVWIDADGLVRRVEMDLQEMMAGVAEADQLEAGTMTMDFFGYGDDVEIQVPDPSEVTPFSEAMGGLGGMG